MTTTETLAARIRDARSRTPYSPREIARMLAMKPETFKKWEAGLSEPRANKLVMLAGVLNVTPAWLLSGDEEFSAELTREQQIAVIKAKLSHLEGTQRRLVAMLEQLSDQLDEVS